MTRASARSRRWNIPAGGYELTITINADYEIVISRDGRGSITCSPLDAANLAIALQQAAAIASVSYAKATKAKVLGGLNKFADVVIGMTKGGR